MIVRAVVPNNRPAELGCLGAVHHVVASERGEFDFQAWLATSRPPFADCVRAAVESLAVGRGDLRDRLVGALLIMFHADGRDVPGRVRPSYEAIREEVERRAGTDFGRLRPWLARCKVTASEVSPRRCAHVGGIGQKG
jgi:hypothetical protein